MQRTKDTPLVWLHGVESGSVGRPEVEGSVE
jgi:hypothetical protein